MKRLIVLAAVAVAMMTLAQTATAQKADGKATVAQGPRMATAPVDASGKPISRSRRWLRSEVRYLQANVRHPALYFDSVQEKLANDDASANNFVVGPWAVFYEIIQFPAQMVATPVLWIIKPVWTIERTEP
jgi:hypothetical protein